MSIVEVFSLLGGVGLFLFGMTIMSAGLKNARKPLFYADNRT